nr:LytTR family DNA-binding domain-containing protein [Lachnospiraceae bacterium]
MIRIAIVEDSKDDRKELKSFLERYEREKKCALKITEFDSGINFIEEYKPEFDLIFMDISMPHMNGMDVARKLRNKDTGVQLIFLTSLAKYAVEGYEVNARMFLVKPVSYLRISIEMDKIATAYNSRLWENLLLNTVEGMVRVNLGSIYYIQSDKHYVVFHTDMGDYRVRGKLSSFESALDEKHFAR